MRTSAVSASADNIYGQMNHKAASQLPTEQINAYREQRKFKRRLGGSGAKPRHRIQCESDRNLLYILLLALVNYLAQGVCLSFSTGTT